MQKTNKGRQTACFLTHPLHPSVWWQPRPCLTLHIHPRCCLVAKSCQTLCDPMDCSSPGSSVHGISQARTLEQVAISFSRGSSRPTSPALLYWQVESLPLSHQWSMKFTHSSPEFSIKGLSLPQGLLSWHPPLRTPPLKPFSDPTRLP